MLTRVAALSKSRPLLVTLVAVIALALAGTTYAFGAMTKQVTLTLDGQATQVEARGETVADVLEAEDVQVGPHDQVAPGLDEQITDGSAIAVRFGKPLELEVDGESTTHWVLATDVAGALSEIGTRFRGADLSVSRSMTITRAGLELAVVTPKQVKLAVGNQKMVKREVAALTVKDVLEALDIELGKHDVVKPGLKTEIAEGDTIDVTRIRIVTKAVTGETIDFTSVERSDSSMYSDESETVRAGVTGLRDVTYKLTYRNGKLVATKLVKADVTREPVSAIVKVGTQERPAATNFVGGSTVWDSLARCESGGNWAINTGNGYYGGLQFSLSTWRAYGGSGYPHTNSREEQIRIAQKVVAATGGYGSWPHCSQSLGLPQ